MALDRIIHAIPRADGVWAASHFILESLIGNMRFLGSRRPDTLLGDAYGHRPGTTIAYRTILGMATDERQHLPAFLRVEFHSLSYPPFHLNRFYDEIFPSHSLMTFRISLFIRARLIWYFTRRDATSEHNLSPFTLALDLEPWACIGQGYIRRTRRRYQAAFGRGQQSFGAIVSYTLPFEIPPLYAIPVYYASCLPTQPIVFRCILQAQSQISLVREQSIQLMPSPRRHQRGACEREAWALGAAQPYGTCTSTSHHLTPYLAWTRASPWRCYGLRHFGFGHSPTVIIPGACPSTARLFGSDSSTLVRLHLQLVVAPPIVLARRDAHLVGF
jgi:hypothetical protein